MTVSPWLIHTVSRSPLFQALEQRVFRRSISISARPNSRWCPPSTAAAQLAAHRLLAVADAQHRHAQLEDPLGGRWAGRLVHAGRPARQDDRLGGQGAPAPLGLVEGMDLAIDARLPAPGGR